MYQGLRPCMQAKLALGPGPNGPVGLAQGPTALDYAWARGPCYACFASISKLQWPTATVLHMQDVRARGPYNARLA